MIFCAVVLSVLADYMQYVSYYHHTEYNWEALSRPDKFPYQYKQGNQIVYFNFGKNAGQCDGEKGSVVRVSPHGCQILGNHQNWRAHAFFHSSSQEQGVIIQYKSQRKCKQGNLIARTTFRIKCGDETPFQLKWGMGDCYLKFQKSDPIGCGSSYAPYYWLLLIGYSCVGVLVCVLVIACLSECMDDKYIEEDGFIVMRIKSMIRRFKRCGQTRIFTRSAYETLQKLILV